MTNEELVVAIKRGENREGNLSLLWKQTRPFIVTLAKQYKHHAEVEDLVQESFFGLMEAVEKYDPARGVKFLTYAGAWARQSMTRYICTNCGEALRIPEYRRVRALKYRRTMSDFERDHGREPSDLELMTLLSITDDALLDTRIDSLRLHAFSVNIPIDHNDDDSIDLVNQIPDPTDAYQEADEAEDARRLSAELWSLVDALPTDQAQELRTRYQEGQTIEQTAQTMQKTSSAVRSIERRAIRTLRKSNKVRALLCYLDSTDSRALRGFDATADTAINNVEREEELARSVTEWRDFIAGFTQRRNNDPTNPAG